jgi:hypothetical protein
MPQCLFSNSLQADIPPKFNYIIVSYIQFILTILKHRRLHINAEAHHPVANMILFDQFINHNAFEHFSATPRPESQMRNSREALEVCELIDLSFSGFAYTYENKRGGSANVQVRLDRAVADNSWRNLFAEARVVHKVTPCSDRCAIVLECIKEEFQGPRPARRYYEVMWERDSSLPERVATAWEEAGPKHNLGEVKKGLGCVISQLQEWSKAKFWCSNQRTREGAE